MSVCQHCILDVVLSLQEQLTQHNMLFQPWPHNDDIFFHNYNTSCLIFFIFLSSEYSALPYSWGCPIEMTWSQPVDPGEHCSETIVVYFSTWVLMCKYVIFERVSLCWLAWPCVSCFPLGCTWPLTDSVSSIIPIITSSSSSSSLTCSHVSMCLVKLRSEPL